MIYFLFIFFNRLQTNVKLNWQKAGEKMEYPGQGGFNSSYDLVRVFRWKSVRCPDLLHPECCELQSKAFSIILFSYNTELVYLFYLFIYDYYTYIFFGQSIQVFIFSCISEF